VAVTHTLLLKCAEDRSGDSAMALALAGNLAARRAWRGMASPTTYIYLELITPVAMNAADRIASEATRRMSSDLTVDRLELHCDLTGASAASPAPFHYVVETDAEAGSWDELMRWYDDEHLPRLAAVPGCVRAQRFVNHDGGPRSHACYDLTDVETLRTPQWLAVRHTPWSDRVRPQFRNTIRAIFRSLPDADALPD
jgi:hypothetical protein